MILFLIFLVIKKQNEYEGLSDYFSFTVKSVGCRFTDYIEFDNDIGCEYIVYLTPNLPTNTSSQ